MPISPSPADSVALESLRIARRALPQTFTSKHARLATIPVLDAFLEGGIPCGAITEVFGGFSSGKTTFAHVLISAATRNGEFAAWVDVPNALDPECARRAGARLEQLLWVSPLDRMTALRVVDHVLGAGGFRLIVLDLDDSLSSRSLPASAWLRVNRAAVRRDAAVVVLSTVRLVGAFAALSIEACLGQRFFDGESGPRPVFTGAMCSFHLRRYKFGPLSAVPVDLCASTT